MIQLAEVDVDQRSDPTAAGICRLTLPGGRIKPFGNRRTVEQDGALCIVEADTFVWRAVAAPPLGPGGIAIIPHPHPGARRADLQTERAVVLAPAGPVRVPECLFGLTSGASLQAPLCS